MFSYIHICILGLKEERNNDGLGLSGNTHQNTVSSVNNSSASEMVFKGPMHELLFITKEGKLIELYFEYGETLVYHFVSKILCNVIGKRKWNNMSCKKLMNIFITNSDEAFAMLVMENNCLKWEDEYENPGMDRGMKIRTKWTETEDGSRNWSVDGMRRYMELYKGLESRKQENKVRYYDIMNGMKRKQIEKHTYGSNKRKIKDLMQDEESAVVSNNELEELEAFLM